MRKCASWLFCVVALMACKNDEFILGFDQLCPLRAENICAARASCCAEGSVAPDCVEQETDACTAERDLIAGLESELTYDSSSASLTLDEEQAALSQCEGPFPLPSFFEGALALDEPCTRDTHCASGHCGTESEVCESAEQVALCPAE